MARKPTYEELKNRVNDLEKENGRLKNVDVELTRYKFLINSAQDAIFFKDLESRYLMANRKTLEAFGLPEGDVIGKNDYEIMPDMNEAEKNVSDDRIVFSSGEYTDVVKHMTGADKKEYWFQAKKVPQFDSEGKVIGLVGIARDITDQKRAESELQQSREDLKAVLDATLESIILLDRKGIVSMANQTACDRLKIKKEDLIGKIAYDLLPPDVAEERKQKYEKVFVSGRPISFQDSRGGMTFDQSVYPIFGEGDNVEKVAVFSRNITEQSKLEQMFFQSQKFEAIGTLAGGIAHDFNNLMMSIQGRVALISDDLEPSHPHWEHIEAIKDSIRSAAHLTKQLLGFARRGKYEVRPIDINELLAESAAMFGRTKKEIDIHTRLLSPPPVVEADRRQMEQVLLNMYINAWQAMPDGGELHLQTDTVTFDDASSKLYQVAPGRYVKISIRDTGVGMDKTTCQQIFDPFYTTKDVNRGTGLGLASAYGIIKNHAGIITVNSEVGKGAEFNIYLPLSEKEVCRDAPEGTGTAKGSETILLVEDEEKLLEVEQAMLEKLGYRVIAVTNGKQAVDAVKKQGDTIDLVILDLIMPEMRGDKAFELIRKIKPAMPVILSSGYSRNGQASGIMQRGCNAFLQKPFEASELSRKIRKILDNTKN